MSQIFAILCAASLTIASGACKGSGGGSKTPPVPSPTGVSAVGETSQVTIDWIPVAGATSYNIYWSIAPGVTKMNGTPISGVSAAYVHAGRINGTTYYYVVSALNGQREGAESVETSAMPLDVPTPVPATAGTSEVTVDWGPVSGATIYNLYWGTTTGVNTATGNPIPGVSAPYVHTGRTNGTTYFYVVTALNTIGGGAESGDSAEVSAMPLAAPTGVSATGSPNQVTLDWNAVTGAASYELYWDTAPGVSPATGTRIPAVSPPYLHAGLGLGATYHYVVTASNLVGGGAESLPSLEVSAIADFPRGLDMSFGGGGFIVHDDAAGGSGDDVGRAIAVDSLGRILVAGSSDGGVTDFDMVVWRLNDDGSLDTTFNGQGWVVHDNAAGGGFEDSGEDIALDSSGRILVAGYSWGGVCGYDMVIWRFNSDGTLDTTFNGLGWVVHDSAAGGADSDSGHGLALDASGRIVVAGRSRNAILDDDMVVWRFNDDGSLDTTFNGLGWVVHDSAAGGAGNDTGLAITLDSAGKILVAGNSSSGLDLDSVIWRFNDDGTFDATFNGQGWVVHDGAAGGTGDDTSQAIALDATGRIVVAGQSRNAILDDDMAIWRYNPDGTLDPALNGLGWLFHHDAAGGGGVDAAEGTAVDGSGRILATGFSKSAVSSNDMVIWRYNPDGTLDLTFGIGGVLVHNDAAGGDRKDRGFDITLDASDRILVTGLSKNPLNHDMVVWRVR
ncbi:MAG: SBBP repeat-containing protein [Planctomycetota bacterium]|nr:SBBP repeat-containing protein [Planctomycetota bacterium]